MHQSCGFLLCLRIERSLPLCLLLVFPNLAALFDSLIDFLSVKLEQVLSLLFDQVAMGKWEVGVPLQGLLVGLIFSQLCSLSDEHIVGVRPCFNFEISVASHVLSFLIESLLKFVYLFGLNFRVLLLLLRCTPLFLIHLLGKLSVQIIEVTMVKNNPLRRT